MMIPILDDIIDTQCGFKAFRADIIDRIVRDNIEMKFAFDIELLIKLTKLQKDSISQQGIAWIDSEAASTTKDLQPYLPMLQAIADMNIKYMEQSTHASDFVQLIKDMDDEHWQKLLSNIPRVLKEINTEELNGTEIVTIEELTERAEL